MLTTIAGIVYGSVAFTCVLGLARAAHSSDAVLADYETLILSKRTPPDPLGGLQLSRIGDGPPETDPAGNCAEVPAEDRAAEPAKDPTPQQLESVECGSV
jgi:hypothetical protein